jgi:pentatricopeptide repeat domain-containing protein 1
VPHVGPSLQYLDSRAFAAFMKDLAKNGHVARAMELFDWIKDLSPVHDLAALADVYSEHKGAGTHDQSKWWRLGGPEAARV